jgi:hypothetical protein
VVREGVGAGGRNDPSLYAHMNNKRKKKALPTAGVQSYLLNEQVLKLLRKLGQKRVGQAMNDSNISVACSFRGLFLSHYISNIQPTAIASAFQDPG